MAFPCLEEGLDAPSDAVDVTDGLGVPDVVLDVCDKDLPVEESELFFGGMESFVSAGTELASPFVGDLAGDGEGDESDKQLFLGADADEDIERFGLA